MQCPVCKGTDKVLVHGVLTGEIGDMSTEEWPCGKCDGTGQVPPEDAMDGYAVWVRDAAEDDMAYLDETRLGA